MSIANYYDTSLGARADPGTVDGIRAEFHDGPLDLFSFDSVSCGHDAAVRDLEENHAAVWWSKAMTAELAARQPNQETGG